MEGAPESRGALAQHFQAAPNQHLLADEIETGILQQPWIKIAHRLCGCGTLPCDVCQIVGAVWRPHPLPPPPGGIAKQRTNRDSPP
jgi:hypothetical protein